MRKDCNTGQHNRANIEDVDGGGAPSVGGSMAMSADSQASSAEQPRKRGSQHWASPREGTRRTGRYRSSRKVHVVPAINPLDYIVIQVPERLKKKSTLGQQMLKFTDFGWLCLEKKALFVISLHHVGLSLYSLGHLSVSLPV